MSKTLHAGSENLRRYVKKKQERHRRLQERFLLRLRDLGFRAKVCTELKIDFHLPSHWAQVNPTFKARLHAAEDAGRYKALEIMAAHMYDLALHGWNRPVFQKGKLVGHDVYFSTPLMIHVADCLTRSSWTSSPTVIVSNSGPSAIQINLGGGADRKVYHGSNPESVQIHAQGVVAEPVNALTVQTGELAT